MSTVECPACKRMIALMTVATDMLGRPIMSYHFENPDVLPGVTCKGTHRSVVETRLLCSCGT